jgi:hypothetical protein
MKLFLQSVTLDRISEHDVDGALKSVGWTVPEQLLAEAQPDCDAVTLETCCANGELPHSS